MELEHKYNYNLPVPYSKRDLNIMLRKFRYTKNSDMKCLNNIYMHNLRTVFKVINTYEDYRYMYDELFSAGCYGLLKAIYCFDCDRKVSFSTYAINIIKDQVENCINYNEKFYRKNESLEGFLEDSLKSKGSYINGLKNKMIDRRLSTCLKQLSFFDSSIIYYYFGFGKDGKCYTTDELHYIFNVSEQIIIDSLKNSLTFIKMNIAPNDEREIEIKKAVKVLNR